jgi:hypothetical protein
MKNVKTKTVKSYLYLNIANQIDAMANVHYIIGSYFSQNIQTFQTMFRIFKKISECSESVQNFQTMFRIFRIYSDFSINASRKKLVYSGILNFVVIQSCTMHAFYQYKCDSSVNMFLIC